MAPNHCFMHPGLGKQRAKRGACPSKAAGQPLWAVGAARKAHGLCELPREHSLAPAPPESDLKYETNGLNSPLEGCCSTRVPAAAFQPFLAATHRRNRDAVFPRTVRACFGETRGELIVCGLGCAGGVGGSMPAATKHVLWLPPANQAVSDLCYLRCSKL